MRQKYFSIFCGLFAIILQSLLVSCDEHEPTDHQLHVGYILCDDHSCLDAQSFFDQSSKKAVGVIFAESTDEHPALAVMLNETQGAFCDSLGLENGTSKDITAFDGFTNTISMFQSKMKDAGKGCPISETMFRFHHGGQSDYIPSVAEQRLLVKSAGYINDIIAELGGTPIDLTDDTWYWTSTAVKENPGYQAWLCSSARGGIIETPKTEIHKARGIVRINYPDN